MSAGEEFGLLWSNSWIERNEDKQDEISNMINRDGGPTVPIGISRSAAMMDDFEQIYAPMNDINPDFAFEIKKRESREKLENACVPDSGLFAVKGFPTIGFGTGDSKGYNFSYREIWHTKRDLYNKSIQKYQEHAATATTILIYGIAKLDHLLSREDSYIEKVDEPEKKRNKKGKKKNRNKK